MSKHTTLDQLKMLANRSKVEIDKVDTKVTALSDRVDELVTAGGEPNIITAVKVNGTAVPITDKAVDISVPGYTVEKAADSGEYAAVYQFKKDGAAVGAAINIPKDMVVQEGSVVTDPEGQAAGTYIKLVLQNVADPLFINVGSLIEYVTSGSAEGDMVFVTVDPVTHKVTATITDGTITKAKLAASLVAEIEGKAAGDHVHAVATAEANGFMSKEDKAKLDGFTEATDAEVTAMLTEVFGAEEQG